MKTLIYYALSAFAMVLLATLPAMAQPANNDCANATVLTVGSSCVTTSGTTVNATQSIPAITCASFAAPEALDVWYQFVAPGPNVIITVAGGTGFDAVIDVRSGSCNGTNIACADATTSAGTETVNLTGLIMGQTYLVRVYDFTGTGTFTICAATPPPPPANDNCAGAISLTVNADYACGVATTGTTVSATQSTETAPSCSATGVNDDVWYTFTATGAAHQVRITGATNTTAVAVYTGSCGALTQISGACASTSSGTANLNLTGLTAGTTYRVRVYTTSSTVGTSATFTICVGTPPPPPANDNCAGALSVAVNPDLNCTSVTTGTVTSATASTGPTSSCGTFDDDVWFSFVATASTHLIELLNVTGSATDLTHQVLSSCGAATSLVCSDPNTSTVSGLTPGQTYFIRVATYTSTAGQTTSFSVCVKTLPPPPANDNCAGALSVAVNPDLNCTSVTMGTVTSATASTGPTSSCGTFDDDVWFSFVATAGTHLIELLNVTGSATDLTHQVLSSCGAATSLVCSDPNTSTVSGLTPGQTYFIRVATYTSTAGQTTSFSVCVKTLPPPPANDNCAGATNLTVFFGTCSSPTSGTTVASTQSIAPISCNSATSSSSSDVWYSFVATAATQTVTVAGGTGFDAVVDVRSGSCNGTNIACADATFGGQTETVALSGLTIGATYYVRVYSYAFSGTSTGTFTICVTAPIPPCNAPGAPSASNVSTNSATLSWAAAPGATLYRYSSGTAGHVCGTGSLTTAGTSVNLTGLTPNTTYTFCVRTDACGGGSASSYVSTTFTTAPLPNDACAGAITVTCGSTISGSTVGATSDSGVGSCGIGTGGTPGSGVWYKLVGNGAQATVSLCGSSYDTKLHVYSGSCGSLTCLTSSDDFCGPQSQVVFNANVGTDYYILVSGYLSNTGAFSMNISCLCGPAIGAPWTTTGVGGATGTAIDNVCENTLDVGSNGFSPSLSADKMNFIHQNLCGNQSVTVKVKNITNGGFAGIMFRESTAAGAKMVAIKTQLNTHVTRDARATTNGPRSTQQVPAIGHSWLRLVRTGNIFTGYRSNNGVTWQSAFTVTVAMTNCVEVGLFTQGINVNSVATASFSNISGIPTTIVPLVGTGGVQLDIAPLEFSLFPNPAQSEINVKMAEDFIGKEVTVQIMNQLGQTVMVRRLNEVQNPVENIRLDNFTEGVYFLTLRTEGQEPLTKKFIVKGLRP